jgi:hypothetical protein
VASGSVNRTGIIVATTGTNVDVYNNIVTGNTDGGIDFRQCSGGGCSVDNNIAWDNGDGTAGMDVIGALKAQATNTRHVNPLFADAQYRVSAMSPAVDTGTGSAAFFPDRDGNQQQGAGADLGAYEYVTLPEPTPTPTPEPTPTPTPEPTPEPYAPACAPDCDAKIADLESQVGALTAQVQSLTALVDSLEDRIARILAIAQE